MESNQHQSPDSSPAGMQTLSEVLTKVVQQGYVENFSVKPQGLHAPSLDRFFTPAEVHIVNFYRFEGASSADDMAILYVIETSHGIKGTLVDAYGTYADNRISEFINAVHDIHKKVDK